MTFLLPPGIKGLSKKPMKKAKTPTDFHEGKINIFGKKSKIYFTSTGHWFYYISLFPLHVKSRKCF